MRRSAVSEQYEQSYWVAKPGDTVMTREGFPGVVNDVQEGPQGGNETYIVTLKGGMGGGEYSRNDIHKQTALAVVERTAADDYPELGGILGERPPLIDHMEVFTGGPSQRSGGLRIACGACGFEGATPSAVSCPRCGTHVASLSTTAAIEEPTLQVEANFGDRVINWLGNDMAKADPSGQFTNWCRFRRNSRCFYAKNYDHERSQQVGYAVWIPEDRGPCPRSTWEQQKSCPISEPGPNVPGGFTDATIPWEQGGQRGVPAAGFHADQLPHAAASRRDPEFLFHFTAAWVDVRAKASRIVQAGHVRVLANHGVSENGLVITAEVQGDTDVYQTSISRVPGRYAVAMWECGCAWASYSWGRSGRWRKYEGRMCSHALALTYEAQKREMFGKPITHDQFAPSWRDPSIVPKTVYDKDKRRSVSALEQPESLEPTVADESAPAVTYAQGLLEDGVTAQAALNALLGLGMSETAAGHAVVAAMAPQFPAQIQGLPCVVDISTGIPRINDEEVPDPSAITYPTYDPSRGLRLTDAAVRDTPATTYGLHYDPADAANPEVLQAKAYQGWDALPTTSLDITEPLHALEGTLSSSPINSVVSGREPFRTGYDPHILIGSNGTKYVIDGHHRVAMHTALHHTSMPSKVLDLRRQAALVVKADGTDYAAAARAAIALAQRQEPGVTADMQRLAAEGHATLSGLEHRIKSPESMTRKITTESPEFGGDAGKTAAHMSDPLRYTMVLDPKNYTSGVEHTLSSLAAKGYNTKRVKNYWERGDNYNGVNSALRTPQGLPFELQFHTPQSLDVKQNGAHPLYEKFRTSNDPRERYLLDRQMTRLFDAVPQPDGILGIPTLKRVPNEPNPTQIAAAARPPEIHYQALTDEDGTTHGVIRHVVDHNAPDARTEVYRGGKWVTENAYARHHFMGEPTSVDIDEAEAHRLISAMGGHATADLHDEPEPALPFTDSGEDDDIDLYGNTGFGDAESGVENPNVLTPVDPTGAGAADQQFLDDPAPVAGRDGYGLGLDYGLDAMAAQEGLPPATSRAYLMDGPSESAGVPGQVDPTKATKADIAQMAKLALASFSPAEQRELIEEGIDTGVTASNFDRLDLTGTHYQLIDAARRAAEEDSEEMFL